MRTPYCCDATRDLYEQYYINQQKGRGDFPVHVGVYRQRGYGLGSMFANLARRILPFLKSLAPKLMRTGASLIDDVNKGSSFKDAALRQVPETLSSIVSGIRNQSGSGVRRKRTRKTRRKKQSKRRKLDIFS